VKNLYHTTELVRNGQPNSVIVIGADGRYQHDAEIVQLALEDQSGVTVPIVVADDVNASVPLHRNVILLGNRSTNQLASKLYDQFYTLTDLKYPGHGGYEVRTLHNPFGNGINVVLIGGSDDTGVNAAAKQFAARIAEIECKDGFLTIGHLMDIKLGEGRILPEELKDFKIWEASNPDGYGEAGYFGWNSISKRLAMYYMTGDEFHAREAMRLSFPDAKAKQEIADLDAELIEHKDDPLAGPYHYAATHMILMWDLVEESPVFTDEERLNVTNGFSRQLKFRESADEGNIYALTAPSPTGSGRHSLFSALSLYCLGRYFAKDYPDAVWRQSIKGAQNFFAPLRNGKPWLTGSSDNIFWYITTVSPALSYVLLSGDRSTISPENLKEILRTVEVIHNGSKTDANFRFGSLDTYNKAAYLTGDGRWITYRNRLQPDTNVFRLGQSFWPDESLQPAEATDLHYVWSITYLPPVKYATRKTGFPPEQSFANGSFRTTTGDDGDFILLDGMNGGGRNPYHTFAVQDLRINGQTILQGYLNQVMTKADGMVEPTVALDGALRFSGVTGQTAAVVGEVPNAAYSNWKRTLAQRTGRYALFIDELSFRTDNKNFEIQFLWQRRNAEPWVASGNSLLLTQLKAKQPTAQIAYSDSLDTVIKANVAELYWRGAVKKDTHRTFFSVLGPIGDTPDSAMECVRIADNAATLRLPQAGLAVAGQYHNSSGDLVILATDHIFGVKLVRAGVDSEMVNANVPVELDWDFQNGVLIVVNSQPARLRLALSPSAKLKDNGKEFQAAIDGGWTLLTLEPGRHTITGAEPAFEQKNALGQQLADLHTKSRDAASTLSITQSVRNQEAKSQSVVKPLKERFATSMEDDVEAYAAADTKGGKRYHTANNKTIYAFDADGKPLGTMQADGTVIGLHWWPEHELLIAGCIDDNVIAFDAAGNRKWTFVSLMDADVFRSAKQYWFKTAAGHEGIHGLDSGVFINGKSQLFVGSACTLEIIDENGELIKRLPQYWGALHRFKIMPKSDGSLDLLTARRMTDLPNLGIVNNRRIATDYNGNGIAKYAYASPEDYKFQGVPEGFTPVIGWMDQTRFHIFHLDIDGDGKKEVVGEITGAWNRVSVWDEDGKPKYTAYFGPGENVFAPGNFRFPKPPIRDIDIADVNGDGKLEIVLALSNGLAVALDGQCRRLWSARLGLTPTALKIVGDKIVIAGDKGAIQVLDGLGNIVQSGQTEGLVRVLDIIDDKTFLAAGTGGLKAFALQD
jgi:hypothetical protein